jgi:hypothetical protein
MIVTRTYARLPLNDLSPERFEDLCLQVAYRMRIWTNLHHYGSAGQDGAIDIFGEFEENCCLKTCVIQCKRVKNLTSKNAKEILNDFKDKNPSMPDEYILITACNPSRKTCESFKTHAVKVGIHKSTLVSAACLEADLYASHPDLLFAFFGISLIHRRSTNVARVKHRLSIKKKICSKLLLAMKDSARKVIIHDVNRDVYPEDDVDTSSISSWFRLEYYKPYFKGISFYLQVVKVLYCLETGQWLLCDYNDNPPDRWEKINAFMIGNIPYDNIVDFDIEGDEYYSCPHFYCQFDSLGEPYESVWYLPTPEFQKVTYWLEDKKRLSSSFRKTLLAETDGKGTKLSKSG